MTNECGLGSYYSPLHPPKKQKHKLITVLGPHIVTMGVMPTTLLACLLCLLHCCCRRRAAHAARNEALNREMSRQQHAFLLAYQRDVAAGLKEQGGCSYQRGCLCLCSGSCLLWALRSTPEKHCAHATRICICC